MMQTTCDPYNPRPSETCEKSRFFFVYRAVCSNFAEVFENNRFYTMNISYKWLKEYVDFSLTAQEVGEALTSVGLEVGSVEEVQAIRGGLAGLVVGQVVTCEPHPNSDHMHVCTVDIGTGELQQIVCGAPNVAAGQKVIVATLGTTLYDGDNEFKIKKSKLRGIDSLGMICAEDEIGVGTSHDGIMVLPEDTRVGMPAADYFHLESDWLIEVDITPNRSDGCSHLGVARDLYAWLVSNGHTTALHRPSVDDFMVDDNNLEIDIEIENAEACPHYVGVSITGCDVKESPEWLKTRLQTIGLRPINNIVDVTNYVMFAVGQPLHCFDADMIEGKKVVVKTLPEGTPFVTLDGVEHKLSERDLAICNAKEPMCIAGVFGGKGSGTYETTCNVFLESAYFHPTWIRKSARRHGLQTDASFRFERGIDPAMQVYALKLAALMIKELAGGKISMQIKDVVARQLPLTFPVELEYKYVDDLIGKAIPHLTIHRILNALEMKIVNEDADKLLIEVPAYRVDVQRPCDVVEDILRIYGYNNVEIPTTVKASLTIEGEPDRSNKLQNLIGEQLVGGGFNEVLNNSLTKESYYAELQTYPLKNCVRLMNPLSSDLSVMRQTLLMGGLENIQHNVNRKISNLRLFEYGNCYLFDGEQDNTEKALAPYSEERHLGLWITGKRVESNWAHADEDSSFFELKGYVMNILARLGLNMNAFVLKAGNNDVFSKSINIEDRNGKVYVQMGVVSRKVLAVFDIEQDVFFADLNWNLLMKKTRKQEITFKEVSKYPAVSRDLALLVDKNVEFAQIEQIAYASERKLLKNVRLFDVYEGKNLEPGKKSYAVNFTLQDESKTMNDKQTDAVMQKIIQNLEKQLGARLR